jgi:hypothetical protein
MCVFRAVASYSTVSAKKTRRTSRRFEVTRHAHSDAPHLDEVHLLFFAFGAGLQLVLL